MLQWLSISLRFIQSLTIAYEARQRFWSLPTCLTSFPTSSSPNFLFHAHSVYSCPTGFALAIPSSLCTSWPLLVKGQHKFYHLSKALTSQPKVALNL